MFVGIILRLMVLERDELWAFEDKSLMQLVLIKEVTDLELLSPICELFMFFYF